MWQKGFIVLTWVLAFTCAEAQELAVSLEIASNVSVKNAKAIGYHNCSVRQSSWIQIAEFQVDSNSPTGFTMTAEFANGFGWALNGTGSTQDVDFNSFHSCALQSSDTSNYVGNNSLSNILPVSWKKSSPTTVHTIENGSQSSAMTDWTVGLYARWAAASGLMDGIYSQILTITIAPK